MSENNSVPAVNKKRNTIGKLGIKNSIIAFVILFVFSAIAFSGKNFLTPDSLQNLFRKGASDGGFLALGMTFVILIAQIDLSVGAVLALGGMVMTIVGNTNPVLGIILGLACGLLCGFLNGFMVAKMKISSWIATLAMMLAVRAVVLLLCNQKPIVVSNPVLLGLGDANFIIILLLVCTAACMLIGHSTRLGLGIYAVGGNEEAAKMMGLKVARIKIICYVICGFLAALAGMVLASRLTTAEPNAGNTWETTAIAMCALGGIKLSGGEGKFSGTFFGIMIIAVIKTIFNYAGNLNSWWQNIIMGILVLISIGIQSEVFDLGRKKKAEAKA